MNGLLVINKPSGITSRAVVDRVQRWFPKVRIGHAGTLDPLAKGVLVICLGSATRLIEYVQRMAKTYRAGIRLGATSDTDDADGTVQSLVHPPVPTEAQVLKALAGFIGEIDQVPPAHSAAHVEGQRAYKLARRGVAFDLQARPVYIRSIAVEHYAFPDLEVTIECGKGTYIRSLARDLGRTLGCGGLVQALERTRIGPFRSEHALPVDAPRELLLAGLLPPKAALAELPTITLSGAEVRRLCQGQRVRLVSAPPAGDVLALDEKGEAQAVASWRSEERLLVPVKVLAHG